MMNKFTFKKVFQQVLMACLAGAVGLASAGEPVTAARINGVPLYATTVAAMLHFAPVQQPRPSAHSVRDELIANRLLASWARTHHGAQLHAASRVTFDHEVQVEDQLVASLRALHGKQLEATIKTLPGATLAGVINDAAPPEALALDKVFGGRARMRLEYTLDAAQTAQAGQIVLMRYTLPGTPVRTISLLDVFRRQNVQGRMEFFNHNKAFIREQANLRLASLFVLEWARHYLGEPGLADLRRALGDELDVRAAMSLYGIAVSHDAHSHVKAVLEQKVSAREIAAYYKTHKASFVRTEKVKARHIRVADEALATQIAAQAAAGTPFATLARRHSTAPDAAQGGELGWLTPDPQQDWLTALALLQEEGVVSRPYRAPGEAGQAVSWEIVLVEKRVEGHHPPDSETVRYVASKAIAHGKALAQFAATRKRLLREATIEVAALAASDHTVRGGAQ
jgi:hypothetical protein